MAETMFDETTRRGASRRTSLLALGGAAVAATLGAPSLLKAKRRKSGKGQCRKQRSQCRGGVEEFCATTGLPEMCLNDFLPCCDRLTGCTVGGAVTCVFDAIAKV